jgi:RNA polymerase sigma-70 factor (ECF subfamily)
VAIAEAVERAFRAEGGAVLASLIRVIGDFQQAEDALHDACATALERWPVDGVPDNPAAWITTTARRKAIDRLRRGATSRKSQRQLSALAQLVHDETAERAGEREEPMHDLADDQLRLIFTCCHPALSQPAQVALTLRTLCGLSTTEIARAFLTPEVALAQRLVRAKKKIREAKIPYRVPPPPELPARLGSVLSVVYLVFNEGYAASEGAVLVRLGLSGEAIRLGRLLCQLLPDEPEVAGLLALMLLHDSRKSTRVDAAGELVLLEDQDRSRWDRPQIDEGRALLRRALGARRVGTYQLQAAIAAVHAEAERAADTDWPQIAALYASLERSHPSPVVALNRAVAVAMAESPERGLALIAPLEAPLGDYCPLHAARADLLRRLGRRAEAMAAYRRAAELAENDVTRRFLERRLQSLCD